MKKLLSVLTLTVMFPIMAFAGTVKIAELNWQSGSMLANIDAIIIEKGYGHDVEIIPGGTEVTINSMLSNSTPDIFSEAWVNLLGAEANTALSSGTLGLVTKDIIAGAGEGFYIPSYILEANPELTSFEAVLARPDLFPHPEDPSKGAMMICPGGWSCQNQHINLFIAFDMEAKGWKLLDPGSGAGMDSAWQGAVAKEQALFGYYWSPTALVGSLGIVKLAWDTPYAGDDNWQNCIAQPADTCSDPLATAMPVAETGTVVVPENLTTGVLLYLAKRKMPEGVTETMLVFGTENQASAEDMAVEFLRSYPEVWERWVSSKAKENIWATVLAD
tara:strand:- start:5696 stop:6688 length:993 start_codon:yes stop_codon:yes gene_type:complete